MSSLSLRALAKRFGRQQVLHGIDLDVAEGEFMVLVGPSGSGKTTLLRMIAGLERITEGELLVGGRRMNGVPPRERDMAMVFQNYALYPHMSVRENLGFSLRMRGAQRSRIEARVRETAHLLGLEPLLERHPAELSGGQQQRVAIGRAIVRDPQVFLFDEPLSNLDGSLRTQMRTELAALHRRLGTTSLYVTHDQTEAMAMADRIAVLRAGRIEQLGTPLELYDRPANLFVAGFIGSPAMNLVSGVARRLNGSLSLQAADGTWLPLAAGAPAREGQAIVYGFRPEACSVDAAQGGVPATVAQVETIGPTVQVYARLAGTTVCAVSSERRGWRAGDEIRLAPHLAKVQLFEPGTGKAL